jgi:hypothetical protein
VKRKNPKYVHAFVDHDGRPRFYLRAPGRKRVPLPGLPWSPAFMSAYEKALKDDWSAPVEIGASRTRAGTVNAALVSYYQSTAFGGLAKVPENLGAPSLSVSVKTMATNRSRGCTEKPCKRS